MDKQTPRPANPTRELVQALAAWKIEPLRQALVRWLSQAPSDVIDKWHAEHASALDLLSNRSMRAQLVVHLGKPDAVKSALVVAMAAELLWRTVDATDEG